MDFLRQWFEMTWYMVVSSAFFLIIGFILAGLIRALLTPDYLQKAFGRSPLRQVFMASLIGAPLPLCSCSVLPVAAQLRRSGLSREGTASFLISTPETGADSIALSWKLLGPVMAIVRPLAAILTSFISGLLVYLMNKPEASPFFAVDEITKTGDSDGGLISRIAKGWKYVWTSMLPELSVYLFWGYLLAGLVAAMMPDQTLAARWPMTLQYIGTIVLSLPIYVCATSSTPLAAVLLFLGMTPGAVLAFLLVGPASNLTALVVQKQFLGLKATLVMTISIIITAIGCGLILDFTFADRVKDSVMTLTSGEESTGWHEFVSGILFSAVIFGLTAKHYYKKLIAK